MQTSIRSELARALNLGACAHYRSAPRDGERYNLEGHVRHGRFLMSCPPRVVPYIIADLAQLAIKARSESERDQIAAAIGELQAALEEDARPPAPRTGPSDAERGHLGIVAAQPRGRIRT